MNNCAYFPSTFTVQISEGLTKYYEHILHMNATDLTLLSVTQTAVWPSMIVIFSGPHREREAMVGGDLRSPHPALCWLQPGAEPGQSFKPMLPGLTLLGKYYTDDKAGLIQVIYDELAKD